MIPGVDFAVATMAESVVGSITVSLFRSQIWSASPRFEMNDMATLFPAPNPRFAPDWISTSGYGPVAESRRNVESSPVTCSVDCDSCNVSAAVRMGLKTGGNEYGFIVSGISVKAARSPRAHDSILLNESSEDALSTTMT